MLVMACLPQGTEAEGEASRGEASVAQSETAGDGADGNQGASDAGEQSASGASPTRGPKPDISDGELRATSQVPPITSMVEFLKMYTDDELAQVTELVLSNNAIAQVASLERLPNLEFLALVDNQIETLRGTFFPRTLHDLWIGRNRVSSLDQIPAMPHLLGLQAPHNEITSTAGLSDRFPNLTFIDFAANPIEDFSGLLQFTDMEYIRFGYNRDVVGEEILEIVEEIRENNPKAKIYW